MKFIHIADVHLGALPDKGHPWSDRRGQEIWQTFRRIIKRTEQEGADLLLIAGDLFHREPLNRELKEVNYLFGKLSRTQVVLIAGNHDYLKRDSNYLDFEWADNVIFLDGEECERVSFPEIGTYVYGCSYHSREIRERVYDRLVPGEEPGIHILLAHGGDENHIPIEKGRLASSGFDYIALGHIHRPEILVRNRMAYSGALEPIDVNDTGQHGYMTGECRGGEMTVEFVPFSARQYVHLEIRSGAGATTAEIEDQITEAIFRYGREHIYSVRVTGFCDPDMHYQFRPDRLEGHILDITDQTRPDYDFEELARIHGDDVIGRYIRKLGRPGADGEIISRALIYGVSALLGHCE